MIRQFLFIAVISALSGIMSCTTDDISCQRVSSEIITDKKDLTGFDGVVFTAVGDVRLIQGNDFKFTMQGPKNVVEAVETEIVGSDLLISSSSCFNGFTGDNQLIIKITAPSFVNLEMSGTGDMKSVNTLTGEQIAIAFLGVGSLIVDMDMDSAHTEIAGSGMVKLTGVAGKHDLLQAGTAAVDAAGLVTDTTKIVHRSNEDGYIFSNEFIEAELTGSGNVYYQGNPVVQSVISGSGKLIYRGN